MLNPNSRRTLRVLAAGGGLVTIAVVGFIQIVTPETLQPATTTTAAVPATTQRTTTSAPASVTTNVPSPVTSTTASESAGATTLVDDPGATEDGDSAEAPVASSPDLYVAPSATGSGSGLSQADAASIDRLNELVAELPLGGVIELIGNAGPYRLSQTITISAGGTADQPVIIRGPEDGPRPEFIGDRANPYDPAGAPGIPLFRLAGGADHLVFSNLSCADVGNGCFYVAAPITDLTVTHVSATNVRRFFENGAGEGQSDATIVGLTISNVAVSGFSKGAIRLAYDTRDVRIADVNGDSMQFDGDNFAIGVHLVDTVHDVVIERVTMDNARDTLHEYWNGDGFAAEIGVYDLVLTDTSASGNTDAGYDLKASDVRLVNAAAAGNKRNFRLWGQGVVLEDCVGVDPEWHGGTGTQAQLHLAEDADVEVLGGSFTDGDADTIVFDIDDHAHLVVRGAYIERSAEAVLSTVDAAASLELIQIEESLR